MSVTATYEQVRAQRVAEAKAEGDHYRTLSSRVSSDADGSWTAMADENLMKTIAQAARRVHNAYSDVMEFDDLQQEAWIILATRLYDRAQECLAGDGEATLGTLQHELEMDLIDMLRPIARRLGVRVSLDALREQGVEI